MVVCACDGVQYAVRNEKKAETLIEKMNGALKTNRTMTELESLNANVETVDLLMFNSYSVGSKGYEPEVVGTIFGSPENKVSNAIKGRSGVFVVEPLQFTPAEALEDMTLIQRQLQMMFQQNMVETMRMATESKAKITDNRSFYF